MDPSDDFEHQLLLSSFGLASHSLRLLAKAGLLDDDARGIIRAHLGLLQEKIEAVSDEQERQYLQLFLDTLTGTLPPTSIGGNSPTSE